MRHWLIWPLLLIILVACGGDKEETKPTETPIPNTAPTQDTSGTPESVSNLPGQVMQPGIVVQDGLEVLSSRTYSRDTGVSWIVMLVKNNNPDPISSIVVIANLLDSKQRERDSVRAVSPLQNIPAGLEVPMVLTFSTPPDYTDFSALVQVDRDSQSTFTEWQGVYDLPASLDPLPSGDFPLAVTGKVSNTSAQNLVNAVVTVGVYDADGTILGASFATITGLSDTGEWTAGSDITFSTNFSYLPAPIAEARVVSAGYSITGQ